MLCGEVGVAGGVVRVRNGRRTGCRLEIVGVCILIASFLLPSISFVPGHCSEGCEAVFFVVSSGSERCDGRRAVVQWV